MLCHNGRTGSVSNKGWNGQEKPSASPGLLSDTERLKCLRMLNLAAATGCSPAGVPGAGKRKQSQGHSFTGCSIRSGTMLCCARVCQSDAPLYVSELRWQRKAGVCGQMCPQIPDARCIDRHRCLHEIQATPPCQQRSHLQTG